MDPRDVLHAFEQGADRVLVLSCNPDSCRYLDGASRAQRRVTRIRDLLQKSGISPDRLFWGGLTAAESRRLAAFVTGKAMSYSTGGSPAAAVAQPLA